MYPDVQADVFLCLSVKNKQGDIQLAFEVDLKGKLALILISVKVDPFQVKYLEQFHILYYFLTGKNL